jgi:hypothetical protein
LRGSSFGLTLRRAKAGRKRSCASKKLKRDDDSKKSHRALASNDGWLGDAAALYAAGHDLKDP